MANTYSKIYVQVVFAVKYRNAVITKEIREPLQKYITGIIQKRKNLMLAMYAMPDHIHILIALQPDQSVSDLVRDIKSNSSKFLNEEMNLKSHFQWQNGFGAFSYSDNQLENVKKYIFNQEEHHRKIVFREEFVKFLDDFNIEHDPRYHFQDLE
jgi:REP element-mobilizing transposase RayT